MDLVQREVVGDQGVEVHLAGCETLDRGGDLMEMPPDVLDADLLAPHVVHLEAQPVALRDAHDDDLAARLDQLEALVDRLLLADALEDDVQPVRLGPADLGDDIAFVGIARPVGPELPGQCRAIGQQVGLVDGAGRGVLAGDQDAQAYRAAAEDADPGAVRRLGELAGPHRDGIRLGQRRLRHAHRIGDRKAARLGHEKILAQRALHLLRAAQERLVAACMDVPDAALVALPAGDQRIDGDAVADLHAADGAAGLNGDAGTLVPHDPGVLDQLAADASGLVVVHVAAAYADGVDLKQHVCRRGELGLGHLADLHLSQPRQKDGLHR